MRGVSVARTLISFLSTCPSSQVMEGSAKLSGLRKNLGGVYPFGGPARKEVPAEKVDWNVPWKEYQPPDFTIPGILKGDKPWADPPLGQGQGTFAPKFNELDGPLDRRSYTGKYGLDEEGRPLNPVGRTGLRGRGSLGKWGPNHAADCVLTRWKVQDGKVVEDSESGLPIVQFVAIRRQDSGEVAIPGGMVDPGETPLESAKREFIEEVIGEDKGWEGLEDATRKELLQVFDEHSIVDKTYVDDRRSTDNAWIETCAVNFHISKADSIFHTMKFKSGSDAREAFWIDYHPNLNLYASHGHLMKAAVDMLHKKWKSQLK